MCPHRVFCAVSLCKDALVFAPAKPVYYGYSNQQNAPQKTAVLCDTGKGEFIMARVYNFSAGPSMLPEKVLQQAQAELLEYGDSGQSVMEMSHRSKWFDAIIKDTEATLRRVMNIPDNYKVGFFQGGATQQFAMVPLNFMTTGKADYLVTGNFSNLAAKEAAKFGEVNIVASSKDKNFTYIPDVNAINYDKDASYIHICQNNTIFGTQFVEVPQVEGVPLVADMSSMILSKPVDVTKYGCIYFGVQKNVAPAGMAIAIVRDDMLGHAADNVPTMMNYTTLLGKDSMYNTPPCWCIYMTGLVLKYLENDIGGLSNMQKINEAKAKVLYDYLDGQDFFTNPVEHRYRSTMNVTFTSPNADLDKKFCAEAAEAGFVNLKGHRLVGGMRASIYNAMPAEGVDKPGGLHGEVPQGKCVNINGLALSVIANATPPLPKGEALAVHANFIFMPRALPLGELDAKRPERASTLINYRTHRKVFIYVHHQNFERHQPGGAGKAEQQAV